MAPVPTIQKKKEQQAQPMMVAASEVIDDYGNTLDYTIRKQRRTNRDHDSRITTNRQHAQQYESKVSDCKLIYRDVFPGRKYKLTLSDTTWMGGGNVCTIGYTVGESFTQIDSWDEAPEDNVFDVEMPVVQAVDTMEVRMEGASESVRGYIEDNTTSSSILSSIAKLIDQVTDLISGQDKLEDDVEQIQRDISSLDSRVTALEEAE